MSVNVLKKLVVLLFLINDAEYSFTQFTTSTPKRLNAHVNTPTFDVGPTVSRDGLILFFVSGRPGGFGEADIWMTKRNTTRDEFEPPVNPGTAINSSGNDFAPEISADGLTLYFATNRFGGLADIWVAKRASRADSFKAAVKLGASINTSFSDDHPSITHDELILFFVSDRPGGFCDVDLWMATRKNVSDTFGIPINLGPIVNSDAFDSELSVTGDGLTLYFASERKGGYGKSDIWVTRRAKIDLPFETPVNLGSKINTPDLEVTPEISTDGKTLYFGTDRPGGGIFKIDIWKVSMKTPLKSNRPGKLKKRIFQIGIR